MKSRICALLVLALLLSATMAIGPTNAAESNPVGINVMMFCYTDPTDKQMVVDAANALLAEADADVKIEDLILVNSANYKNQITLMLASQEPLDAYFESFGGRSDYFGHVNDGLLYPMNELIPAYGQGIVDAIGMEVIEGAAVDGMIYGIPGVHEWAVMPSIMMRKDLVEKYDIDLSVVKTGEDFTEVLKTIKENEPDIYPMFTETNTRNNSFIIWAGGGKGNVEHFGDDYGVIMDGLGDDLTIVNLFATEEYRRGVEMIHSWYEAGYIYPDVLTAADQRTALFQAGRVFCMNSSYKPGMESQLTNQLGHEMTGLFMEGSSPLKLTSVVYSNFWSIPYYSAQPEAAMRFINQLYVNSDLVTMMNAGIEGTHYVVNEDQTISYADGLTSSTTGYPMASTAWAWGNQLIGRVWSGDAPDLYEKLRAFNDSATPSPALGFVFNTSNVTAEIAAVKNVITEYQNALELGVSDPATALPQFLEKLDAAGLPTIIAEKQSQLNDWAAAK